MRRAKQRSIEVRGIGFLGLLAAVVIAFVAGAVGYNVGLSVSLAAAGTPVAYRSTAGVSAFRSSG